MNNISYGTLIFIRCRVRKMYSSCVCILRATDFLPSMLGYVIIHPFTTHLPIFLPPVLVSSPVCFSFSRYSLMVSLEYPSAAAISFLVAVEFFLRYSRIAVPGQDRLVFLWGVREKTVTINPLPIFWKAGYLPVEDKKESLTRLIPEPYFFSLSSLCRKKA